MDIRGTTKLLNGIALIGQLGLSLLMPLLLCLGGCYLLVNHTGVGPWIYLAGFVLGLGGSFSTAYGVYRSVVRRQERHRGENAGRRRGEISVSRHL
ncbi:MAG: AtpZ/AtpI family protein [Butyrivibrio sp.]|nr:AtpZ/AtpI family protein [Butyrivibrio sp.]